MPATAQTKRKRTRKRKRRAASSSSSSSSDSSSPGLEDNGPVSLPPSKVTNPLSSSDSESDSSSSSDSSSDDEQNRFQRPRKPITVQGKTKEDQQRPNRTSPSPSPSPPPVDLPSFLPSSKGTNDIENPQLKEQEMKLKFRQFWMSSVADGFRDELEELRKVLFFVLPCVFDEQSELMGCCWFRLSRNLILDRHAWRCLSIHLHRVRMCFLRPVATGV